MDGSNGVLKSYNNKMTILDYQMERLVFINSKGEIEEMKLNSQQLQIYEAVYKKD